MNYLLIVGGKGEKQSSSDDDNLRAEAKELARNFILVDTYRPREANFASSVYREYDEHPAHREGPTSVRRKSSGGNEPGWYYSGYLAPVG